MHLGYYDEARAFRDWLMRAVAGAPAQMQILYGVGGERWLPEFIIPWLPGYEKSPPVRIGNAASEQLQLDIYGEISDAMFQAIKGGMEPSERGVALQPVIMEHLAKAWREPDEGIWETRGGRQHFVHSKVMAWVAFDRAANLMKDQNYAHSARGLREIANEIHADICNRGFDPALDSFVQAYGSKRVDASLLVIPLVGSFRQPTPASGAHFARSRISYWSMTSSCSATIPKIPPTVCLREKEPFWHAAFGSWTITYCREGMRKPVSCLTACSAAATRSACSPRRSIHRRGAC
jgi:GH15 family glucan-1,4-alpha-glucosidase